MRKKRSSGNSNSNSNNINTNNCKQKQQPKTNLVVSLHAPGKVPVKGEAADAKLLLRQRAHLLERHAGEDDARHPLVRPSAAEPRGHGLGERLQRRGGDELVLERGELCLELGEPFFI